MSIKYAILGFLSWRPMSGYDVKKMFGDTEFIYWAGSNNQIYSTLIEMQHEGLVSSEVQQPERGPARKVYTVTQAGLAELRKWLGSAPEPPELRNTFLLQLAWADRLDAGELDALLAGYERQVELQLMMARETARRDRSERSEPRRTERERYLWERITQNRISFCEQELAWARETRVGARERAADL